MGATGMAGGFSRAGGSLGIGAIAPLRCSGHNPGIIALFPTPWCRMRPADDLAIRVRNWFWYWQVRGISGLTNNGLDRKCFGKDEGRKRHFERLEQTAASPSEMPLLDGCTLLEIVDGWDILDGHAPYAPATQAFHSPLWSYLSTRDQAPNVYSDYIQQYVQQHGWMRLRADDMSLYLTFLGQSEPAIQANVSTAYSAMLHKLVGQGTPDALAVLIALFREAMHGVLLEQAIAIKSALKAAVIWMCELNEMPDQLRNLLWQLVHDRVLSNTWLTESDWRQRTGAARKHNLSSRARIKEFRAWVTWYVSHSRTKEKTGYGAFPIVPRSARIDWLEDNRDALNSAYNELIWLQGVHHDFRDSCAPNAGAYAEAAQNEINRILGMLPPPNEESARFYESRPAMEMGNLPRAY